ncbi:ferredoxin [Frankia sp. AiPa1]|uniref:ferredoxin n=1 Tax=Frankia sp. AiPa1 TaxID=573492 RepID=UPI00202AE5D5|nr:ferredoxin [Frankia sp. AiPa1]MCL9760045.1 ferredoxin [Frankia sp. AiPa1]
MAREIRIDRDRCMGSGQCMHYAPAVFGQDEDDIAIVLDPDGGTDAALLDAAQGCPTTAISVHGV